MEYLECQTSVDAAMSRCIKHSAFINGPEVVAFEQGWKEYVNSEDAAGVSSGTSALMLALLALGISPGDEVIVPGMSFISTAEVASQIGAIPVFCDINAHSLLDARQLPDLVTARTKAIILVNLYGQTMDLNQIRTAAPGIPVIEDAAQSSVCSYNGLRIGNRADATCWSFYPGKNLSAMGDAGAVTGSRSLIESVRMLRDHGRKEKYLHQMVGWNERLDGLQAAIILAKLPYLETWNSRRQHHAEIYLGQFADVEELELPQTVEHSSHVYNQFVVQTDHRDSLRKWLLDHGIETGIQFPLGMHQQPVYQHLRYDLPQTETLARKCLSLPVHAHLCEGQCDQVIDAVKSFFSRARHNDLRTSA
jgi:dTDP-4-amino-4,6-dideoxygalactose transaminase